MLCDSKVLIINLFQNLLIFGNSNVASLWQVALVVVSLHKPWHWSSKAQGASCIKLLPALVETEEFVLPINALLGFGIDGSLSGYRASNLLVTYYGNIYSEHLISPLLNKLPKIHVWQNVLVDFRQLVVVVFTVTLLLLERTSEM